jgi:CDP-diacylglycerol--glycerol-3-phosphate 3-phosphatidyltransferase
LSKVYSLPNLLTISRLLVIPIIIVVFYLPWHGAHYLATGLFILASVTDWLDGYLARRWGQVTLLGAFLDPVADKVLVATCLLLLVGAQDINYITIPSIVIVGREIVISALRELMAEWGKRASVAVGVLGKIKTCLQMTAIVLLLAFHPGSTWLGVLGVVCLYVAAILTIWSMVVYIKIAWYELFSGVPELSN